MWFFGLVIIFQQFKIVRDLQWLKFEALKPTDLHMASIPEKESKPTDLHMASISGTETNPTDLHLASIPEKESNMDLHLH